MAIIGILHFIVDEPNAQKRGTDRVRGKGDEEEGGAGFFPSASGSLGIGEYGTSLAQFGKV